jgi:hypothetical protein
MRQSGSALRKLIRPVAAAGLWGSVLGKDQERNFPTKTQALKGMRASGDRPLIGPGSGLIQEALFIPQRKCKEIGNLYATGCAASQTSNCRIYAEVAGFSASSCWDLGWPTNL